MTTFNFKLRFFSLLLCTYLVLLSGCAAVENGAKLDESSPPVTVQPPAEVEENAEPAAPLYTAPLTGMPMNEPVTARPLAIMINNAPAARPQSGLLGADIVYEVLAEGGVTRLVSIFQSHSDGAKIGPIRSIRPYMIELGESYGAVLVHAGASNDAYAILQGEQKDDLDEITNAGPFFWRDKSRKAPHNLYSNVETLLEGADKRGYALEAPSVPSYSFRDPDEVVEGEAADRLEVQFQLNNYKVQYQYNASTGLYERSVNGTPHIDLESEEPLSAANVVVIGADHKVLDDVGRLSIELDLGGEAVLFQQGKMIRGQWIRRANDVIRFVKDNEEIPFVPGTTYFNIVPNSPDFDSHLKVDEEVNRL